MRGRGAINRSTTSSSSAALSFAKRKGRLIWHQQQHSRTPVQSTTLSPFVRKSNHSPLTESFTGRQSVSVCGVPVKHHHNHHQQRWHASITISSSSSKQQSTNRHHLAFTNHKQQTTVCTDTAHTCTLQSSVSSSLVKKSIRQSVRDDEDGAALTSTSNSHSRSHPAVNCTAHHGSNTLWWWWWSPVSTTSNYPGMCLATEQLLHTKVQCCSAY